jgi:hypothetical protein
MRIEGYPIPVSPAMPQAKGAATAVAEDEPLTAQEKLRRLLEERHSLTEAIFSEPGGEGELGKHIDLRV